MGSLAMKAVEKTGSDKLTRNAANLGFFDFKVPDIDGKTVNFVDFQGKAKCFVVVNVACSCGLTGDHYKQLVELHQKYHSRGLQIMGFPCNQFKNQESGSEAEIKKIVQEQYSVTFPMFSKIHVNGP